MLLSGIGVPASRRGGGGGPLDTLFAGGELGDYWDMHNTGRIYEDAALATEITATGSPMGGVEGIRGSVNLTQATSGLKTTWDNNGTYGKNGAYSVDRYVLRRLECNIPGFSSGDFTVVYFFHGQRSIFDYSCNVAVYKDASNYLAAHHGTSQDGEYARSVVAGAAVNSAKAFDYSSGYQSSVILWRKASDNTFGIKGRTNWTYLGDKSSTQAGGDYGDNISFMANPHFGQGIYGSQIGGFAINRLLTGAEETLVMDTLEGFIP